MMIWRSFARSLEIVSFELIRQINSNRG